MKKTLALFLALTMVLSLCACTNTVGSDPILQGHHWGETENQCDSIGEPSSFYGIPVEYVWYGFEKGLYLIEYKFEFSEENAEKLAEICRKKLNMPATEKEYYEDEWYWDCYWYEDSISYDFQAYEDGILSLEAINDLYDE